MSQNIRKSLSKKKDERREGTDNFILIATSRVPCAYGMVFLLDPIGDFANGDVVRFCGGKEFLAPEDGEYGGRVKLLDVRAADCEKIADLQIIEACWRMIFGARDPRRG